MNRPRYITFDISNYEDHCDMFADVAAMFRIMVANGYVCSFRYDDCGIYVLEYDYNDEQIAEFELWHKVDEE